jgi:hypothetical protein
VEVFDPASDSAEDWNSGSLLSRQLKMIEIDGKKGIRLGKDDFMCAAVTVRLL